MEETPAQEPQKPSPQPAPAKSGTVAKKGINGLLLMVGFVVVVIVAIGVVYYLLSANNSPSATNAANQANSNKTTLNSHGTTSQNGSINGSTVTPANAVSVPYLGTAPPYTANVYYAKVSSNGIGVWAQTTTYPNSGYQLCGAAIGYIYCVNQQAGGITYYAPISSSGVGAWKQTTTYPFFLGLSSCGIYNGTIPLIYCVGGTYANRTGYVQTTSGVYYARISGSGIGTWQAGTSYPTVIKQESCDSNGNYIYCVGGYTLGKLKYSNGTVEPQSNPVIPIDPNFTYYAPISGSGIGTWVSGDPQNSTVDQYGPCSFVGTYAVCTGGNENNGILPNGNNDHIHITNVYYAALSPTGGIGAFNATTMYPFSNYYQDSCPSWNGYIYCIGGYDGSMPSSLDVPWTYFAKVGSGGVSNWTNTNPYPIPIQENSCVIYNQYIYCVGGYS